MRTNGPDPHRILGVAPGATAAEVKRAYRALAKRHHPDAGQGSVIRFLEIQAAYEALMGSAAPGAATVQRRGRRPAQPGQPGRGAPGSGGAGATHAEAAGSPPGSAWARRPAGPGTRHEGPDPGAGGRRAGAARPEAGAAAGGGSPSDRRGRGAAGRRGRPERERGVGQRRATLGSTSYDGAEDVFEPDWHGASWYGPSSGTYWTINPKEYADPRKHGPEYQARGRRPVPGAEGHAVRGPSDAGADPPGAPPERPPEAPASSFDGSPGAAPRGAPPGPGHGPTAPSDLPPAWRPHAWTAAASPGADRPVFEHDAAPGRHPTDAGRPAGPPGDSPPRPASAAGPSPSPRPAPAATAPARSAAGPAIPSRVALALLGWSIPGLAIAAIAGLPGGLAATLPLQVGGIAVLAVSPRLAWAAAGAGLVLVLAAIPIVAVVTALGGVTVPAGPAPGAAVVLAALAWLAGLIAVGSGRVAPYPWDPAR